MSDIARIVETTFRAEHGHVLGALVSYLGDLDLAEDALQDAMITALETWARDGVPLNPAAWMTTVARRKAIDRLRRDKLFQEKQQELQLHAELERPGEMEFDDRPIPDERLKLIFACCHPALALESQLALTLRTLGGLTTPEIARAFLVPIPTMNQRITRAKTKIRQAGIPFEIPPAERVPERLDAVLYVLYLIFNEGYSATAGDDFIRQELCNEAIRLARVLVELLDQETQLESDAEALGLLALMLLHDSRRAARVDANGEIVLLEDQDRSLWNQAEIQEGLALLDRAVALCQPGTYQLQAAISALHAQAPTYTETDWRQIAALYAQLVRIEPTPVVQLNCAVAVGMAQGPLVGLMMMNNFKLEESLSQYHLYHAARADLLRRAGEFDSARIAYQRAFELAQTRAERVFLLRRIESLKHT
ncbi:MAG TPA: RNA polymerase sigma factor [Anaerolineae bacterium]|nr:RNA polymerase sigma factor [Anaerolineae bacterium]